MQACCFNIKDDIIVVQSSSHVSLMLKVTTCFALSKTVIIIICISPLKMVSSRLFVSCTKMSLLCQIQF